MIRQSRQTGSRRKGMQTLEVVLVLPLLLMITLAIFQFGVLVLVQQSVTHAATVTVREAGKGANLGELVTVANTIMRPHCITIGPHATVALEDLAATPNINHEGAQTCDPTAVPTINADEVRTTICVSLTQEPFLTALKTFCVDFSGKRFEISSLVKKE